jgi:hypothetical protein
VLVGVMYIDDPAVDIDPVEASFLRIPARPFT